MTDNQSLLSLNSDLCAESKPKKDSKKRTVLFEQEQEEDLFCRKQGHHLVRLLRPPRRVNCGTTAFSVSILLVCYHAHSLRILENIVCTLTSNQSDQTHCSVADPSSNCKKAASASTTSREQYSVLKLFFLEQSGHSFQVERMQALILAKRRSRRHGSMCRL